MVTKSRIKVIQEQRWVVPQGPPISAPRFIEEGTRAQRGAGTCSRSPSRAGQSRGQNPAFLMSSGLPTSSTRGTARWATITWEHWLPRWGLSHPRLPHPVRGQPLSLCQFVVQSFQNRKAEWSLQAKCQEVHTYLQNLC